MKAVTADQMRELDRRAIAAGASSEELMERAGFAVAKAAIEFLKRRDSRSVLLFAGKGNNGGDALVAARHLAAAGCSPSIVLVGRDRTQLTGVQVLEWPCELPEAAVIVDGLLGIGLQGEVREPFASAIHAINQSHRPVVAIDVPSGLGTQTCVRADVTVTMGLPKIDLLREPDVVGHIEVADIGVGDDVETDIELITPRDVELPARKRSAHKGDFGHLLIVAGSEGYTGAPVIAAHAAARSGAGLVTLAVPKEIYPIVAVMCPPEIMPRPLDESSPKHDALAIGPGMGQKPETQKLIWRLLSTTSVPTVVDADALNALAQMPAAIKKLPGPMVLTPHPGEMARLIGHRVNDRWAEARKFVREFGHVLVLKGAGTVVTDKSGKLWINPTGNPGMAKGGMGDALTGVIGALLARGVPPLDAAKIGVFWHGQAGNVAASRCGEHSMLATDLINVLGESCPTHLV